MTNIYGKKLTEQGERIVAAIQSGIAAMTPARWQEEAEKAARYEDEGEWFAPEFAAAREATEGLQWEFDGWANALDYILDGSGKLGGVSLLAETYFALMCDDAENGVGALKDFALREEAEMALRNARINEFQSKYWVEEKPKQFIPVVFIAAHESGNGWYAVASEDRSNPTDALVPPRWRTATREEAIERCKARTLAHCGIAVGRFNEEVVAIQTIHGA